MQEPGMECGMHTQDQEIKQEAIFITISHHAWSTIYDDNLNNVQLARCHIQLAQQSLPTNDRLEDNLVVIYDLMEDSEMQSLVFYYMSENTSGSIKVALQFD